MIGVFDSGAGGLSVLREILKILRSYNDSPEMNKLLAFYFDGNAIHSPLQ